MADCLFCKIVSGEIPSYKVYEDHETYAFLDIFPAAKGHTLVIPKSHQQDILDISGDLYSRTAHTVSKIATLLDERLECDGITVMQSNRPAGWQTIFHLHFHVIPRWTSDSLINPWSAKPGDESEFEEILASLR